MLPSSEDLYTSFSHLFEPIRMHPDNFFSWKNLFWVAVLFVQKRVRSREINTVIYQDLSMKWILKLPVLI